ncbi:hypothetical protein ABT304_29025 [Nocardioides sp. NPDC000445]|uniref:hypothetical protein n=1 Tax=Nocardioides sp. NPDC000445 TaxID=3154257 RepID=UPI00332A05FC
MAEPTDWWVGLLDGALGAFVGVVASVVIALYVIHRQISHERSLAREERRNSACLALLGVIDEMARIRQTLVRQLEADRTQLPPDWDIQVAQLISRDQYALPLAAAVGGRVLNNYGSVNRAAVMVWALPDVLHDVNHVPPGDLYSAIAALEEPLDDAYGAIRDYLTALAAGD